MPPLGSAVAILLAASRFGLPGALATAVLGGLVAGPLTPDDVAAATAQQPSDWLVRLAFFALMGVVASVLFKSLKDEGAALRAAQRESDRVATLRAAEARERIALEDKLREMAFRDPLTGLANRSLLEEHLAAALARARRAGTAVALVCLDLNDFKLVNDSLGHAAGDQLLCQVSRRLAETVRAEDLLARNGGDEFLIMLVDIEAEAEQLSEASVTAASEVIERVKAALAPPFTVQDAVFHIEASAGVSIFPRDAVDADELHRHADAAMYEAKSAGMGMVVFDPAHTLDPLEPLSRSAKLRRALVDRELELHYQPVFHLPEARIVGVEALVRWREPDGTLVLPGDFLPVAEKTGLIEELGDFVLRELCVQAVAWRSAGLRPNLGINVSPRQLRRPGLARHFYEEVTGHALNPAQFVVELTESAWTLEGDRMGPVLRELSGHGFSLALDDFGAGYSTLSRLLRLPVDVIKIDRSFLAPIPADPQAAAIISAILQLAEACECDVVAEGVETAAQLAFLTQRGCSLAQGFFLGRPLDARQATALLHERLTEHRRDPVVSTESKSQPAANALLGRGSTPPHAGGSTPPSG